MGDPREITVKEALEEMAARKQRPLGVLSYDMGIDELVLSLFPGVDREEANAILQKIGIRGKFK